MFSCEMWIAHFVSADVSFLILYYCCVLVYMLCSVKIKGHQMNQFLPCDRFCQACIYSSGVWKN